MRSGASRRHGQDLGFVLARARPARRDIEERGEPCRPEMDADLIGPDLDWLDQRGEDGTRACSAQHSLEFGRTKSRRRGCEGEISVKL
jgi:hypothetical protein